MARPKTKSALVDGVSELVEMMRGIDAKLNQIIKTQNKITPKRGRGRPRKEGSVIKVKSGRGPGRPPKSGRGPGRPPKSGRGPGRPPKSLAI